MEAYDSLWLRSTVVLCGQASELPLQETLIWPLAFEHISCDCVGWKYQKTQPKLVEQKGNLLDPITEGLE